MTNLAEIFSAPFNWCDRRCERCPLSRDCLVWRAESQRRWVHAAHGGDPDDWDVVVEDVAEDMRAALGNVLDIAAAEGIDLGTPLPPAPIVLDAVKLRRAGTVLATSIAELGDSVAPAAKRDELVRSATVLGLKATRIASYLSDAHARDAWDADAVPKPAPCRASDTPGAQWTCADSDRRTSHANLGGLESNHRAAPCTTRSPAGAAREAGGTRRCAFAVLSRRIEWTPCCAMLRSC